MTDSLSDYLYRINLYSLKISRHSGTTVYNDSWKFKVPPTRIQWYIGHITKTHDRTVPYTYMYRVHDNLGSKSLGFENPKSKNISGRKTQHSNCAMVYVIDQTTGIICNVDIFYDFVSSIERNVFKMHSYLTNNEKVSSLMCLLAEDGRLNLWDMTSAFFNNPGPPLKINIRWRSS